MSVTRKATAPARAAKTSGSHQMKPRVRKGPAVAGGLGLVGAGGGKEAIEAKSTNGGGLGPCGGVERAVPLGRGLGRE